ASSSTDTPLNALSKETPLSKSTANSTAVNTTAPKRKSMSQTRNDAQEQMPQTPTTPASSKRKQKRNSKNSKAASESGSAVKALNDSAFDGATAVDDVMDALPTG